jgi:hypothetical protein
MPYSIFSGRDERQARDRNSWLAPVASLLLMILFAPMHGAVASAGPTVLIPINAEGLTKAGTSVLEDALQTAGLDVFGKDLVGPNDVAEKLNDTKLAALRACETVGCWVKASRSLGAKLLIATTAVSSKPSLTLAFRLVDLTEKKVVARHQEAGSDDAAGFAALSKVALVHLHERWLGLPLSAAPAPAASVPAAPAPSTASAGAPGAATTPSDATKPTALQIATETVIEGTSAEGDLATPTPEQSGDLKPPPERALAARWSAGIGFVTGSEPPAATAPVEVGTFDVPTPSELSLDDFSGRLGVHRLSLSDSFLPSLPMPKTAESGSTYLLNLDLSFMFEWSHADWLFGTWFGFGFAAGVGEDSNFAESLGNIQAIGANVRFGVDLHPLSGRYRSVLAVGPVVGLGVRYYRFTGDDVLSNIDPNFNGWGYELDVGGRLRLSTPYTRGDAFRIYTEAACVNRGAFLGQSLPGSFYGNLELGFVFSGGVGFILQLEHRLSGAPDPQMTATSPANSNSWTTPPEDTTFGISLRWAT